ncbi:MAG: phosphoglycerate dehydrogenase [Bradymonadales bacterium]|nr:phosphoglycerate dehydrogenase [Bradymonadales bacterium]
MKVLVTEPLAEEGLTRLRAEQELTVDVLLGLSPQELVQRIPEYEALIVRSSTKVTAEVLEAATRLRIVGRAGTGVDNIDLDTATRQGVVVVNTPQGNAVSVAELTMGLLLGCVRQIARADHKLKEGVWAKKGLKGRELAGKTLGIVGLGRIGREVAARAIPFGLAVLGHDPFVADVDFTERGIRLVDLPTLLAESHAITLHVPMTDQTQHLIGAPEIRAMREGVILINTARGGLVDEAALLEGLQSGKVGAAGLDVFEGEPNPARDLVSHENVVATPHIGASTLEAQEQVGYHVAGYVADYLVRGVLQSAVNYPSVSTEEIRFIRPYLTLAARLGAFAAQVAVGRMHTLSILYSGELVEARHGLLTDRALCAALAPFLEEINPVNARSIARQRGLKVIESTSTNGNGYPGGIQIALTTPEGTVTVEGAAIGQPHPPRLISVNGLEIDAPLKGPTLFFRNDDVPGVIGRVGTFAGEKGINIANFALRSDGQGGAMGVVQVGRRLNRQELEEFSHLPGIRMARLVDLSDVS